MSLVNKSLPEERIETLNLLVSTFACFIIKSDYAAAVVVVVRLFLF